MADAMTSQYNDLSPWDILYNQVEKRVVTHIHHKWSPIQRPTGLVYKNKLEGVQHGSVKYTLHCVGGYHGGSACGSHGNCGFGSTSILITVYLMTLSLAQII
jgi:hypothetical protein